MTRGCPNKCDFCAVHRIEPFFFDYMPLVRQVQLIEQLYGEKQNLILLDNNVLASKDFSKIINDIKKLGFHKGAKFSYRNKAGHITSVNRYVDFNQGLDLHYLSEDKMSLLSEIAIRPVRIAFDDIKFKNLYEDKIRLAAKYNLRHLSNYILYNYNDHPDDFYERLKINVELNEELGLQIFSFPMRYVDLKSKNRRTSTPGNIGKFWNKKFLRSIQCILIRTKGIVGIKKEYFLKAFGKNLEEYHKILIMPESYIINRIFHENDGSTEQWWSQVCDLSEFEKKIFIQLVYNNNFKTQENLPKKVKDLLDHYLINNYVTYPIISKV